MTCHCVQCDEKINADMEDAQNDIKSLRSELSAVKAELIQAKSMQLQQAKEYEQLKAKLSEAEKLMEKMGEALQSYASCGDGCSCGDGWNHKTALEAITLYNEYLAKKK